MLCAARMAMGRFPDSVPRVLAQQVLETAGGQSDGLSNSPRDRSKETCLNGGMYASSS